MQKIIEKVLKDKKTNLITVLCLVFFSLLMIFPIGAIHSSTVIENTSEYLANVAENHTINGKYAAMMIEPNDTTDKKINNPYGEFHYLYGIFREGLATYVGAANADKTHSIRIKEIGEDVNFSFLNVDSGFEVKEYYEDDQGNMVYKTEYYPLELMFYSEHPRIEDEFSFLYISQRRANSLLDKKGLAHTRENYHNLLNTLITLEFDGVEYKYAIDNIYLEQNYFYEALDEVMGEFFLAGAAYPQGIKRQGMFFLRNYAYQNKFYIEYATKLYSLDEFDYKVLDYNFTDGFEIDESKLIYTSSPMKNVIAVFLLIVMIFLLICSILLIVFGVYSFTLLNHLLLAAAALLPYMTFWIIHAISKSAIIFSNFSTISEIWCLLGLLVSYLVVFLTKRNKKVEKTT